MRLLRPKSPELGQIRLDVTGETQVTEEDQRLKSRLRSNYTSVSHDRILVVKALVIVEGSSLVRFETDPNLFGDRFKPDVLFDNHTLTGIMAEKAIIAQLLSEEDAILRKLGSRHF